jgi:hypothetical protein
MLNPFTHKKVLEEGTPGRATVVSRGALDRDGTVFNLPITLHVFVEGMTPYEVEDQWWVKASDAGALQGSIPVRVHCGDPQKVAIDWPLLRAEEEHEGEQRRAALAAMGPWPGSPAAAGHAPAPGAPAAGDDMIARLERLAALHAAGALTDEEFAAQKQRVLGDP